jgi:hypothetical protein
MRVLVLTKKSAHLDGGSWDNYQCNMTFGVFPQLEPILKQSERVDKKLYGLDSNRERKERAKAQSPQRNNAKKEEIDDPKDDITKNSQRPLAVSSLPSFACFASLREATTRSNITP